MPPKITHLQGPGPLAPRQGGGAILEYLLVTFFGAVVGIAVLSFVGRIVKDQLGEMGRELGLEGDTDLALPWDRAP